MSPVPPSGRALVVLINLIAFAAAGALIAYAIVVQLPDVSQQCTVMPDPRIAARFESYKVYYVGVISFLAGLFPNYATPLCHFLRELWPGRPGRCIAAVLLLAAASLLVGILLAGHVFRMWVLQPM